MDAISDTRWRWKWLIEEAVVMKTMKTIKKKSIPSREKGSEKKVEKEMVVTWWRQVGDKEMIKEW